MADYVFVDSNNGHFKEYFNFTSNASKEQIVDLIKKMERENPAYGRTGMKLWHLVNELITSGFECEVFDNCVDRRHIGRIEINGTSGNY